MNLVTEYYSKILFIFRCTLCEIELDVFSFKEQERRRIKGFENDTLPLKRVDDAIHNKAVSYDDPKVKHIV